MGKLAVLEGLDGTGKSTQLERLKMELTARQLDYKSVSFPDYDSQSSALIKMYLAGEFGKTPGDVNAYAASAFYSVDRYASYKSAWGDYYNAGGTVIAGRYTTSNAVHQASKLDSKSWEGFLDWLYDFEYCKIGIPKPDLVLFLDMPTEVSQKLLKSRYHGDADKRDIHERDTAYLEKCRESALFTAQYSGWKIINCADGEQPRSIDDIAADILSEVLNLYNN